MDEAYTKRLSASHSTIIELKPASVWTLITTAGILEKCHPFCESNTAVVWDENEHIDVLVYLNGRRYVRTFHTWTVNEGFSLLIGSEGGAQSYVEWNIEAHGDEHSRLTITVFPYILAKLPRPLALLPRQPPAPPNRLVARRLVGRRRERGGGGVAERDGRAERLGVVDVGPAASRVLRPRLGRHFRSPAH